MKMNVGLGMMFIRSLLLLLASTGTSLAGPWPRGEGNAFGMISLQVTAPNFDGPASYYFSNYLEYGLTQNLTIGADVGHSVSGESKAIVFLKHPLLQWENTHYVSAELGFGQIGNDIVVRPGLSYGRGFSNVDSSGWLTVDMLFEHHIGKDRTDVKADITYGRNHSGGFKSMLQIQTGKQIGDPSFFRIAPSFALPMGKSTHLELGASVALRGNSEYGLKLGFWKEF